MVPTLILTSHQHHIIIHPKLISFSVWSCESMRESMLLALNSQHLEVSPKFCEDNTSAPPHPNKNEEKSKQTGLGISVEIVECAKLRFSHIRILKVFLEMFNELLRPPVFGCELWVVCHLWRRASDYGQNWACESHFFSCSITSDLIPQLTSSHSSRISL